MASIEESTYEFFNHSIPTGLLQKWVEGLRSGKYAQGKEYLRKENRFCVLGILADSQDPYAWSFDHRLKAYLWYGEIELLSETTVFEKSIPKDLETKLYKLNDEGYSFEEIADWIEEHLY